MWADTLTDPTRYAMDPSIHRPSMEPVLARIRAAAKFRLLPDFAQAVDELASDFRQLIRTYPFCRLPFRECWFEVAQQDRQSFINSTVPLEVWQKPPSRVGYLLTATRPDLSAWKAHLFWTFDGQPRDPDVPLHGAALLAIQFDMLHNIGSDDVYEPPDADSSPPWISLSDAERREMGHHIAPAPPDFYISAAPDLRDLSPKLVAETLLQVARRDWAGEMHHITATIALLNARNASLIEYVDKTEHNKKRRKNKQPLLSSHHILRIHPRQIARIRGASPNSTSTHIEIRKHFVRGHWKVRNSGIFFWRPFIRGRQSTATVSKDYEISK